MVSDAVWTFQRRKDLISLPVIELRFLEMVSTKLNCPCYFG